MSDTVIRVEGLGKQYRIGTVRQPYHTLREQIVNAVKAPFRRRNADASDRGMFWALKDVSFSVRRGEVVGVIGRNGAGKSTLLKILSRITEPTEGEVRLRGRVGSLLEVGTGFHPELTGRENVFLNGAILGMRRAEIAARFDEIVAFAEVEKFLDTPVKHYSSGMYMRLAFSVAAHLDPEVLVVDEVLAVGDAQFQRKCLDKMSEVGASGRTVLFVSHNMPAVVRLCSRAILLESGRVVTSGSSEAVVSQYMAGAAESGPFREWPADTAPGSSELRVLRVGLHLGDGSAAPAVVNVTTPLRLRITYRTATARLRFRVAALFHTQGVCAFTTLERAEQARPEAGEYVSTVDLPGNLLSEGEYTVGVSIFTSRGTKMHHAQLREVIAFQVIDPMAGESARGDYAERVAGLVRPLLDWHLAPAEPAVRVASQVHTTCSS